MTGTEAFEAALAARLRDERTEALAGRGRRTPVAGTDHILAAVGRSVLALPLTAIAGVTTPGPVGRLPGAHPAVAGIGRIAGRFTLVVESADLVGQPARPASDRHLLIVRHEPPVAIVVDRVLAIRFLPTGTDTAGAAAGGPVVAVHRVGETGLAGVDTVTVMDVDRLLAAVLPAPTAAHSIAPTAAPLATPTDAAPRSAPADAAPLATPADAESGA